MRSRIGLVIILLILGLVGGAADTPSPEYQVKAAFLLRFLKFVEWPANAQPEGGRIIVAVVDDSPLGDALEAALVAEGKGATIEIRRGSDPDALVADCEVLFIPAQLGHLKRGEHPRWKNLAWLGQRPILTIGEDDDFLAAGGIIAFDLESERVRFDINEKTAERAGLTVSSHLLRLARNHR